MFRPSFSATQVAGIIGRHAYQPVYQVMYEVFKKDKGVAERISAIEKEHNRKSINNFKGAFLKDRDIQQSVFAALDTCKSADDATEKDMEAAKILHDAEAKKRSLELKVVAGIEVSQAEVKAVQAEVEAACQKVIDRSPNMTPAMATQLLSDARGEVAKKRGLSNEDKILNTYEAERKVVLTERNTRMLRMEKDAFTLVGRTDGFVASQNRVVDSKNRTRFFPEVPNYDIIQLRVYMHMLDATDSELIEKFPKQATRHTVFPNDPAEWADIEANLNLAARRMTEILADASSLEDLVFKNTVENGA